MGNQARTVKSFLDQPGIGIRRFVVSLEKAFGMVTAQDLEKA